MRHYLRLERRHIRALRQGRVDEPTIERMDQAWLDLKPPERARLGHRGNLCGTCWGWQGDGYPACHCPEAPP